MEEAAQPVRRSRRIRRRDMVGVGVGGGRHLLPRLSFRRQEEAAMTPPLTQFMKYAVPLMLAILIFRYQSKPDALFRENAALASGIQSALFLLSMFLPYPLSLLPLLIFSIPVAIFLAYTLIITAINKIQATTDQQHNLPVFSIR